MFLSFYSKKGTIDKYPYMKPVNINKIDESKLGQRTVKFNFKGPEV